MHMHTFNNCMILTADLSTSESMHVEQLPNTACMPSFMFTAQAFYHTHTDLHTKSQNQLISRLPPACIITTKLLYTLHKKYIQYP